METNSKQQVINKWKQASPTLAWYLLADLLALLAFVIIGKTAHSDAIVFSDVLETTWPFWLGMLIAGWWLRTPLPAPGISMLALINTTLAGWLLAMPIGLVLRELVNGKPILMSFAITTFIFAASFLIAARLVVWFVMKAGPRRNR